MLFIRNIIIQLIPRDGSKKEEIINCVLLHPIRTSLISDKDLLIFPPKPLGFL